MNASKYLFISFLIFSAGMAKAQANSIGTTQTNLPSWVYMIDNPETNYYEAIKAFDAYWKDKIKPEGEDDRGRESKEEEQEHKRLEKSLKKMTVAQREEFNLIKYHYKRFETWAKEVKPFVQEDGHILTQQEQIDIWKKQQQEIKQQTK